MKRLILAAALAAGPGLAFGASQSVTKSLTLAKSVGDAERCGMIDHGTAAQYLVGIQFYWWRDLADNPTPAEAKDLLQRMEGVEIKEFSSGAASCGDFSSSDQWVELNQDAEIGLTLYQDQTGGT